MEQADLEEYVAHARETLEETPDMDAAATESRLISEFLTTLGWWGEENVEPSHPVSVGRDRIRVTYALRTPPGDDPDILFETVPAGEGLSCEHRERLEVCMKLGDVDAGILTDGTGYQFLYREVSDREVRIRSLAHVSAENLPEVFDLVRTYSKESFESGDADGQLTRFAAFDRARQALDWHGAKLAAEIQSAITEVGGEVLADRARTVAEEAVDDLDTFARQNAPPEFD